MSLAFLKDFYRTYVANTPNAETMSTKEVSGCGGGILSKGVCGGAWGGEILQYEVRDSSD